MTEDWLRTLYSEAWSQYQAQNDLGQSRSAMFLTTQSALIGIISVTVGLLFGQGVDETNVQLAFAGVTALLMSVLGGALLAAWLAATRGGRAYVQLRRAQLRAIERLAESQSGLLIGLAESEQSYRDAIVPEPPSRRALFPNIPTMEDVTVEPYRRSMDGWLATERVIAVFAAAWTVIGLAGAMCFWSALSR